MSMTIPEAMENLMGHMNAAITAAHTSERMKLFKAQAVCLKDVEALSMAMDALKEKAMQEKPRWIPVTEKLPDRNKPVLVRCANTTISGGYVTHIGSCDSEKFWFLRTQPDTNSFPFREWKVTHWMPLPEPPKEY